MRKIRITKIPVAEMVTGFHSESLGILWNVYYSCCLVCQKNQKYFK